MKSVGEVMSMGRTFKESLLKALRSLETGVTGLDLIVRTDRDGVFFEPTEAEAEEICTNLKVPRAERIYYVAEAMRSGVSVEKVHALTNIDMWFLHNIREIVELEGELYAESRKGELSVDSIRTAKEFGFSYATLARIIGEDEGAMTARAHAAGIKPAYKCVDTCGAEFESHTPYLYSTYERPFYNIKDKTAPTVECEAAPTTNKKVLILGSGPNRIGQGVEFDYCCVHASFALKEEGIESIMLNCNPETVSTDYDTSDRLYFEPLTFEDVMAVVEREKPDGVIVQLGGQTPLKLCVALEKAGVKILGTTPDSIDEAEDRERFDALLEKLELKRPESGLARSTEEAVKVAAGIGYPVMVRPSYVLGGRAMEIVYNEDSLNEYMARAVQASPEHPVLVDSFLAGAAEIDVDCVSDGELVVIGAIMEHIEEAGVHSGDSACSLYYRGQPESVPYRALCQQGHRTSSCKDSNEGDDRADLKGARLYRADPSAVCLCEGSGLPVHKIPGGRYDTEPRDEEHRRGDGDRRRLWQGLCQGADSRR